MSALLKDRRAIALMLAASLTVMSNAIISPSLTGIEAHFSDNPNAELLTRMLVAAPSLLVAIVAPFAGMMADRFGRRRQLLIGVALFGVCGTAGIWLPSLEAIFVSRLILGIGVAMMMTAVTALVGDYFQGELRARFMGMQIAAMNFGGLVLIALSGGLAGVDAMLPFLLYGVAILYLPFLIFALDEPSKASRDAAAHAPGGEGAQGWVGLLIAAVVLSGITFLTFYILPTQAAYFLPLIGHPEPAAAAMLMVGVTFAAGVVSLVYGRLRGILGRARTLALGFSVAALGFLVMGFSFHLWIAAVGALCVGGGAGLIMPTLMGVALDLAPAARRGMAAGSVSMAIFLGQFLSPLFSLPLVNRLGYFGTFEVYCAILAICALISLVIFRERRGFALQF
ncbi:MFS transporter [Pseudooceanicola sp. HF7]|uniref:MFS transporter n=1 Tax=Pseudooceanicola sp. HF7 TaxID=2721560 RepID=UPI0014310F9F|nr:MFS transporter [Pseudooceanicola sp. HF7]NIZ08555.1 MFS transporter [Pseudooceanicola sp. HF7]